MSSPLKVALLAHTGLLGKPLLAELLAAHKAGKLQLVVLHRPGSDTSMLPQDVEARQVDLANEDITTLAKQTADLNVIISTVALGGVLAQNNLVEALKGSKNLITFIPSEFGSPWTAEELAAPELAFLGIKEKVNEKAAELGVPLTRVHSGAFTDLVWGMAAELSGMNPKNGVVESYKGSLDNAHAFASLAYIAAALVHAIITRPQSLANTTVDIIELEPTGRDFMAAYDKLGKQPPASVVELSQAQWDAAYKQGGYSALGMAIKRKWGEGSFGYDGERIRPGAEWKTQTLEDELKKYAQ